MEAANPDLSGTPTYTFLFTDLEGSTRLWQQYPEVMKAVLERHDEITRTAIEKHNGQVVKTTGDGFHAVFTSPVDGLHACILAQQQIIEEDWGELGQLRVRMGLHSGEAQARGGDYYGTVVNRAARLMSAANGGQVLLSAAVAGMVSDALPPEASLRDLGEHILKDLQHPEHIFQLLHPGLPDDFPAIASLNRFQTNLPAQPSVFVGRQTELDQIKELLLSDQVRLLTLVGPGGTGKTRLSLQAGAELIDQFRDGTYFIDLAPVRDTNSALAAIVRTLGLSETGNGSLLDDIKEQLHEKNMLLLLDNFEQVIPAAVSIAEILQFCPRIKLLVTSRESLHLRGEQLYPVPPLGLPEMKMGYLTPEQLLIYEAIQLFVERARAVKPEFELNEENGAVIAEICRRLDGLPLAIELATARIRLFSPQALLQRLESRFKLLRGGARDLPERQQTLHNTIDWSVELLNVEEKTLFMLVSVFSSCTLEALESVVREIEHLVEGEIDPLEGLASLVDKSLVHTSETAAGEPRFRMLKTIQAFAAEQLRSDPDLMTAAAHAHAAYFADFTEQQWRRMSGFERETAMQQLVDDVENLNIAWGFWAEQKDLEQLHKMVNGLWLLYDSQGWYHSTIKLTTDLLDILSTTPSNREQAQQEIMLQTSLARALMAIKGYTSEVEEAYNRALKLSDEYGEIPQMFPVLRGLSSFYMYRAEFDKGAEIGERILALAESRDDNYLRIHGYLVLGANTGFKDGYQQGLEILDKGIALFESELRSFMPFQLGNNPGIVCYTTSAFLLWWLGYPDQAVERANRAVELVTELDHPFTMAYALFHTGSLHMWRGEMELAKERGQKMLELAEKHGFQIWISLARMLIGATQMVLGAPDAGLENIEQGFELYQGLKTPPLFYPQLITMRATALAQAGRPGEGLQLLNDLLEGVDHERALRELTPVVLLRGELLLAASPGKTAEAAELFWSILESDVILGAKLVQLQVATRLCRLEMKEGKAQKSGQILDEIYNSFTEGFETDVLQEARVVLEEWRASSR